MENKINLKRKYKDAFSDEDSDESIKIKYRKLDNNISQKIEIKERVIFPRTIYRKKNKKYLNNLDKKLEKRSEFLKNFIKNGKINLIFNFKEITKGKNYFFENQSDVIKNFIKYIDNKFNKI